MSDESAPMLAPSFPNPRDRLGFVTYAEVEKCARELLLAGQRPSQISVRQKLGHGAPSTIGKYLASFWRKAGELLNGVPSSNDLPPELARLLNQVWAKARELAIEREAPPAEQEARLRSLRREVGHHQKVLELREEHYRAIGAAQRGTLVQAQAVIDGQRRELEQVKALAEEYQRQVREARAALEELSQRRSVTLRPRRARVTRLRPKRSSRRPVAKASGKRRNASKRAKRR